MAVNPFTATWRYYRFNAVAVFCVVIGCIRTAHVPNDYEELDDLEIPSDDDLEDFKMKTFVILVGGVRWDDLDRPGLEGFESMAKEGVRARYVNPVYPSNSYVNLYSIVTGLYAENHGYLNKDMLGIDSVSPLIEEDTHQIGWWHGVDPIWSAAGKEHLRADVYFFPGACQLPQGQNPRHCSPRSPTTEVTDTMIRTVFQNSLKDMKENKTDLVMLYYDRVQHLGRSDGPDSASRIEALHSLDLILQELQTNLTLARLERKVNLLVISDHGITSCSHLKPIDLEPFSDLIEDQLGHGALSFLQPRDGRVTQLFGELKQSFKVPEDGASVYTKEHIPKKYHLRKHSRLPPLLVRSRKGYFILPLRGDSTNNSREDETNDVTSLPAGCHGYDPTEVSDMRTIFLAKGPAFRRGYLSEPLWNTDHYNLLCHLLDIPPARNNGSWDRVVRLLHEDDDEDDYDDEDDEDEDDDDLDDDDLLTTDDYDLDPRFPPSNAKDNIDHDFSPAANDSIVDDVNQELSPPTTNDSIVDDLDQELSPIKDEENDDTGQKVTPTTEKSRPGSAPRLATGFSLFVIGLVISFSLQHTRHGYT